MGFTARRWLPANFQVTKKTKQPKPVQEDPVRCLAARVWPPPPSNFGTRRVLFCCLGILTKDVVFLVVTGILGGGLNHLSVMIESVKMAWSFSRKLPVPQVGSQIPGPCVVIVDVEVVIVDVRTVECGFVGGECGEWGLGAYTPGKSTAETWKWPALKKEIIWTKPLRIQVCPEDAWVGGNSPMVCWFVRFPNNNPFREVAWGSIYDSWATSPWSAFCSEKVCSRNPSIGTSPAGPWWVIKWSTTTSKFGFQWDYHKYCWFYLVIATPILRKIHPSCWK